MISFSGSIGSTRSAATLAKPAMRPPRPHVTVCICTFRRPEMLSRLLAAIAQQRTDDQFTFSVVVTDNDQKQSGREVTTGFATQSPVGTVYCAEPEQNIALARNRAVAAASGEYIAFLDDDEFPVPDWLRLMLQTCETHHASGVLGPVRPHFDAPPPGWVIKGRFCERPEHPTGTIMPWNKSRTGNLLFRRDILAGIDLPFRPEFGRGGEDVDFFARMTARGCTFVWCNEAVAYETVPPSRCTRGYMLKRALLRGRSNAQLRTGRVKAMLKSAVAAPAYAVAMPFSLLVGQHVFMRLAIRFCDHFGRLLALAGLNPVNERPQ